MHFAGAIHVKLADRCGDLRSDGHLLQGEQKPLGFNRVFNRFLPRRLDLHGDDRLFLAPFLRACQRSDDEA